MRMSLNLYKSTLFFITCGLMFIIVSMTIFNIVPYNSGTILPILPTIFFTYNMLYIYKNSCIISSKEYNLFNLILHIYYVIFCA